MEEAIIEERDSDDEEFLDLKIHSPRRAIQDAVSTKPIQPQFDPSDWQLEVERVTPSLKVQLSSSVKDWRSRLEQMQQFKEAMTSIQGLLIRPH